MELSDCGESQPGSNSAGRPTQFNPFPGRLNGFRVDVKVNPNAISQRFWDALVTFRVIGTAFGLF